MTARAVTISWPGKGGCVSVEEKDGGIVGAVVLCGMQSDGTITPVLVDSNGKLVTTA